MSCACLVCLHSTCLHFFRNPMNAVVGVTDILLDTVGLSDEQTNYIEVIRTSGQHLLTVSLSALVVFVVK